MRPLLLFILLLLPPTLEIDASGMMPLACCTCGDVCMKTDPFQTLTYCAEGGYGRDMDGNPMPCPEVDYYSCMCAPVEPLF